MTAKSDSGHDELGAGFYRRLCERAAVALVATDADFRIVCWNHAAEELLGQSAADMLGRAVVEAVPDARRSLFTKLLHRTMRGETNQFDVHLPGAKGETRDLMVALSPIPGPEGEGPPQGVAAWIVDETRRRELADRLTQAERMASLGTLAGGVAHHFNNILGGVATFVDYALTSGDTNSMKRALRMTAEASARAAKITQSLLSFAAHDTHRTDLADLTEVVLTFSHLVERPLEEKHIALQLDLRTVPIIAVEANRMHQVLGNMLTNAEEAMPHGGAITLRLERRDEDVVLTFADDGAGIVDEHLPLVFEPFFTTKGLLAGGDRANPGLGLSVVHGIVMEMGGQITVQAPKAGAEFTITFPIKPNP